MTNDHHSDNKKQNKNARFSPGAAADHSDGNDNNNHDNDGNDNHTDDDYNDYEYPQNTQKQQK